MSPTVFPCYAPEEREIANAIATLLERCGDGRVFLEEGRMNRGADLAAKAREGRMAEIVLVLFSRHSTPPRWPRAQWEGAFLHEPAAEGVRIGFVRCDEYPPPRVVKPQFDCRVSAGFRELKRWVRNRAASYAPPEIQTSGHEGELEALGIAIADRPGSATTAAAALAFEFARAFSEDFDEVFRLECGRRSVAALAGDLGAQLGMRLEGDLESNLARLREFCAARRFLLLVHEARTPAAREFEFGGRCSTLYCAEPGPPGEGSPLQDVQSALAGPAEWEETCRLARMGRRMAREQGRIAELYEMMQQWHAAAEALTDRAALNESSRELVWILEGWGRLEEARRLEYRRALEFDEQMALPF